MTWVPVEEYGMTYSPQHALTLKDLERLGDWDSVSLSLVPTDGLLAIEWEVNAETVERICEGGFRPGYWPYLARVDGQLIVVDGHHRAAAHWLRGDASMEAKVIVVDS